MKSERYPNAIGKPHHLILIYEMHQFYQNNEQKIAKAINNPTYNDHVIINAYYNFSVQLIYLESFWNGDVWLKLRKEYKITQRIRYCIVIYYF